MPWKLLWNQLQSWRQKKYRTFTDLTRVFHSKSMGHHRHYNNAYWKKQKMKQKRKYHSKCKAFILSMVKSDTRALCKTNCFFFLFFVSYFFFRVVVRCSWDIMLIPIQYLKLLLRKTFKLLSSHFSDQFSMWEGRNVTVVSMRNINKKKPNKNSTMMIKWARQNACVLKMKWNVCNFFFSLNSFVRCVSRDIHRVWVLLMGSRIRWELQLNFAALHHI